jgi:protein-S-isoprenylcysteine O-methyltransferase Ste14
VSAGGTKLASVGGFLLAVAGLAGLLYKRSLFATGPLGISLQVLAFLLMVWARRTFGMRSFHATANPTAGGLVTTGPYRFVRHPIYAAILYFTAVAVATHPSAWSAAMGALIAFGLGVRIVAEEKLVREMYPEYDEYAQRTKRVIPYVL